MAIINNNPFHKNNRFDFSRLHQYPEDIEQINYNGQLKISYQSTSLKNNWIFHEPNLMKQTNFITKQNIRKDKSSNFQVNMKMKAITNSLNKNYKTHYQQNLNLENPYLRKSLSLSKKNSQNKIQNELLLNANRTTKSTSVKQVSKIVYKNFFTSAVSQQLGNNPENIQINLQQNSYRYNSSEKTVHTPSIQLKTQKRISQYPNIEKADPQQLYFKNKKFYLNEIIKRYR